MSTATGRLVIVASMIGDKLVKQRMLALGATAEQASGGVRLLGATLAGLGVGLAAKAMATYSDVLTNTVNKMRLVTKSSDEAAMVTQGLFQIAQETRSGFEQTATVFQRVALALKDFGGGTKTAAAFTRTLGQAIQLSGATAQEANAAMIQLSQGLAKGTLNGDELRSVLEQLPFVADLIAKQMKVTRGELRDLGADGKITTDIVVKAVTNAGKNIDELFQKLTPTIAQGFTVLNNSLIQFFGGMVKNNGITEAFARTLIFIGNRMEFFGGLVSAMIVPALLLLGASALPYVTAAFYALNAAIRANPLIFWASVLLYVAGLLYSFADNITLTFGGQTQTLLQWTTQAFASLGTTIANWWATSGPAIMGFAQSVYNGAQQMYPFISGVFSMIGYLRQLAPLFQFVGGVIVAVFGTAYKMVEGLTKLLIGMGSYLIETGSAISDYIAELFASLFKWINDGFDLLIDKLDRMTGRLFGLRELFSDTVGRGYEGGAVNIAPAVEEGVNDAALTSLSAVGWQQNKLRLEDIFNGVNELKKPVQDTADATKDLQTSNDFGLREIRYGIDNAAAFEVDAVNGAKNGIVSATYDSGNKISGLLSSVNSTLANVAANTKLTADLTAQTTDKTTGTYQIDFSQASKDQMADALAKATEQGLDIGAQLKLETKLQELVDLGQLSREQASAALSEGNTILSAFFAGNERAFNDLMANGDQNFADLIRAVTESSDKELLQLAIREFNNGLEVARDGTLFSREAQGGVSGGLGFNYSEFADTFSDIFNNAFSDTSGSNPFESGFQLFPDTVFEPLVSPLNNLNTSILGNSSAVNRNTASTDAIEALYNKLDLARRNVDDNVGALDSGTLLPGFANGGSAFVPGSGGPDSVPFAAMLSPGERVEFTPRRHQSGGGEGGGDTNITVILQGAEAVQEYRRSQASVDRAISKSANRAQRNARSG